MERQIVRVVTEVGRRARHAQLDGLAHPLRVEERFGDDLEAATTHAVVPVHSRAGALAARAMAPLLDQQRRYNEAVLDALHQLDHRFRWQDERIRQLEVEVDELRARIGADPTGEASQPHGSSEP